MPDEERKNEKLNLEDLSIDDQETIDSIYPINSDSARIAVALLQDHYIEALSQHPGTKIHRKDYVISVILDSVCRLVDLKHPLDQIIYQKDGLSYSPREFEAHFFPGQLRLTTFFNHLKQKSMRKEFILVFNGIDPPTSGQDVIRPNLYLCQGKLNMAVWVSLSATTSWKIDHQFRIIERQENKIERQVKEIERKDNELERKEKEIQMLRKQLIISEKSPYK